MSVGANPSAMHQCLAGSWPRCPPYCCGWVSPRGHGCEVSPAWSSSDQTKKGPVVSGTDECQEALCVMIQRLLFCCAFISLVPWGIALHPGSAELHFLREDLRQLKSMLQSNKTQQQTNFICTRLQLCKSFNSFSSFCQLCILSRSCGVFSRPW